MSKRPRSITIISWIFIVLGGIMIFGLLTQRSENAERYLAQFRNEHPLVYIDYCLRPFLLIVCGVFIFLGFRWARWLFVVWFVESAAVSMIRFPSRILPGVIIFGTSLYYLYRPVAEAFFERERQNRREAIEKAN